MNIFSLLNIVILTRALFVAAELNIAEHLADANMTIQELADITHTNSCALNRMLYFLELHGVFIKDSTGKYGNTDFSKTMCSTHPKTIKPFLLHDDPSRWNSFGHLGYSIKTGKASFDMLHGQSYFNYLKDHADLSLQFDQAMTIISTQEDELISQQLSFSGIVADIGGGKGQLLNNIISRHPQVTGILFDLPQVVDNSFLAVNYTKISGSFFDSLPIKADIFILKRILHDWDDAQALQILRNVSNAMESNSKLFIIDGLLDHSKNKELLAAIDLALLTIFQGKERNISQITTLLEEANLEIVDIKQIDEIICAIECRKKTH